VKKAVGKRDDPSARGKQVAAAEKRKAAAQRKLERRLTCHLCKQVANLQSSQ
jgi:hypothetical protein